MLEAEFQKSPEWSTQRITQIAQRLGLKRSKVYKWNFDRRKKQHSKLNILACTELEHRTQLPDSTVF